MLHFKSEGANKIVVPKQSSIHNKANSKLRARQPAIPENVSMKSGSDLSKSTRKRGKKQISKPKSSFMVSSQKSMSRVGESDEECSDHSIHTDRDSQRMIGPISESDRLSRVRRYLQKKQNKKNMKKFCYQCRKQVAEKRLRIKGRFVTREQAFEILGLSQE